MLRLITAFIAASVAYGQTTTLTAFPPNNPAAPGSQVTIPITMTSTASIVGLQFCPAKPAELSALSVQLGTASTVAGKSLDCNTANPMICMIDGAPGTAIQPGTVAFVIATVAATTTATSTTINFTCPYAANANLSAEVMAPFAAASFPIAQPAPQPVTIQTLTCSPGSLQTGGVSTCTVTLSAFPTGGATVTLSSDSQAVSVPSSLAFAGDQKIRTFAASAATITATGTANLKAMLGASFSSFALSLIAPPSPCDLDGNGIINATDQTIAKDQALGVAACGSADLDGDGKCTVVDVLRVQAAIGGGSCKTGL
jgi:hypothetical protein